jgi:transmembrane sensor
MSANIDLERIDQLITEDLAGIISQEDKTYLEYAIATDASAAALYKEKRAILDTPDMPSHIYQAANVDAIFARERNSKLRTIVIASLSAAAVLAAGFFFYQPATTVKTTTHTATILTPQKNIQLQLPNGHVVDLSDTHGKVQAGNVSLNNTNKTLSYTDAEKPVAAFATLTVPAGKDYKINLADGSEVWMNAATKLKFPLSFNGATREIYLDGEAYLKIAKDPTRPFIVHASGSTVQVLGTAFNINSYDSAAVKVSLVSGLVRVKAQGDSLQLQPGREALLQPGKLREQSFDADFTLSWQKGIYIFSNSPLSEVLQVLPRWFGVQLRINDPNLARKRFTGIIDRNQPIQHSLDILKATNDFDYTLKDSVVTIALPH